MAFGGFPPVDGRIRLVYVSAIYNVELLSVFMPSLEPVANIVRTISLNTPFALLGKQAPEELMGYAWVLGAAWLGLSTVAGLVCFKKKEIS